MAVGTGYVSKNSTPMTCEIEVCVDFMGIEWDSNRISSGTACAILVINSRIMTKVSTCNWDDLPCNIFMTYLFTIRGVVFNMASYFRFGAVTNQCVLIMASQHIRPTPDCVESTSSVFMKSWGQAVLWRGGGLAILTTNLSSEHRHVTPWGTCVFCIWWQCF